MRGRSGQGRREECSVVRTGCGAGGGGKVFMAGGVESRPDWAATETLSAAWLPPKDSASTPPPPVHLAPVSPLPPPPPLSSSLPSLLLLSLPSFTLQFLPLALFFSLHSSISLTSLVFSPHPPPTHPPRLGHYRHSAAGWEVGVGGRLRWWEGEIEGGGTKALRCSGPTRVAGSEKKPDGILMQGVDGQTRRDRQSRLSPLSFSFSWCLFWPKKSTSSALCPSLYAWCFIKHIKMRWRDRWRGVGKEGNVAEGQTLKRLTEKTFPLPERRKMQNTQMG